MENPATWTRAHNVVSEAWQKGERELKLHRPGYSIPAWIVNALKEKGFLTEEALEVVGYQKPKE
jgi:hypothetical protein